MEIQSLLCPWGEIRLSRSYQGQNLSGGRAGSLRAWDAADEYLLQHIFDNAITAGRTLVINDGFGALSCALLSNSTCEQLVSWGDSFVSHQAAEANLRHNFPDRADYRALPSTQMPTGNFDLVVIKLPKTLALLEYQLTTLRPLLNGNTRIVASGMVKHWQTAYQKLFEGIIGPSHTSLARKKARLLLVDRLDSEGLLSDSPYPSQYLCKETGLKFTEHAGVFCRGRLDIGTRFMLQQFTQLPAAKNIVDLGCGNGVLGIMAQRHLPDSQLVFIDESYMAVDSAQASYVQNNGAVDNDTPDKAQFIVSDCLVQAREAIPDIDLVLCNPPFHQQQAVGDHVAWQMLKQSFQALRRGGAIWVVGNRHMNYHSKLKKLFGNCRTVAANKKFVVLSAIK